MTLLPPTLIQQKKIDEEIPPDLEMRKKDIEALRQWLSKQPHLPQHIDDERLEHFLFGCKNSLERCKVILERYFTARTLLGEFFHSRDPCGQDIQDCCDAIEYFVLPSLTDEGHRVTILRIKDKNIDKFSIQTITKRILMVMDLRLVEESCLSNYMILDLEGWSAGHFAKCTPTHTIVRKAMLAVQDSMPLRLYQVHFLNAPKFINNIINIFYPLLKPKLISKFQVHTGNGEELHKHINKDILPNEWGGMAGTFQELNDAWRRKIERNRDWFLREEKLCKTDETMRLPAFSSVLATSELNGIQGSFRQLNID
ncbi:retinol-binding protein pinta-like [Chelonus insularis]|uniref:retinol-binding protein pinta-like n=1 Tax=Chelonus insularis TaxID=460826 RepID=UPI00158A439D|nr:retinol-binding protein pinta-like [Chelonus insularis]XP_034949866.1 retinol-binding protein pinta-like [Chelonus insularis]XP_034949867.1 retinol-binding protein pinta-like [Chelonus insularis]